MNLDNREDIYAWDYQKEYFDMQFFDK